MNKQILDFPSNQNLESFFDNKFYAKVYTSHSMVIEDFFINDVKYCSRITLHGRYIKKSYKANVQIGSIRVEKKYLNQEQMFVLLGKKGTQLEIDFDLLLNTIKDRCKLNVQGKVLVVDPAPHNEWPLWDLARHSKRGARLYLFTTENLEALTNQERPTPNSPEFDDELLYDLDNLENELGLSINKYNFLKNSLILILPYEEASIVGWRIFKEEDGWEGLKCRLDFDRFLGTNLSLEFECKLFDREQNLIFSKRIPIENEYQSSVVILPPKEKAKEIYRVQAHLFNQGILIDDNSGYPLRDIRVSISTQ